MRDARARALRERAERVLPGGVSSPVRAFTAVSGSAPDPVRASGAYIEDADGNRFIDYVLAYGPHILGHAPPEVVSAISHQLSRGAAFGLTTEVEVELAERIVAALPSVEMLRFVNSGTEACMSAVRLARGVTGRDVVVKFAGGYHGHADALLADAGSGVATLSIAGSPGVPAAAVSDTMVLPYNDARRAQSLFDGSGERIAAVIVEPVAGNMGCVPPAPGFLEALRALCTEHGAMLIFDEVMTGFRVAFGGAQTRYGVLPDITCLGKVIGAGLPVAAYAGSAGIMENLAPAGPVYQAGTLSGNPLGMTAGCAVLDRLRDGIAYDVLEGLGDRLETGLRAAAAEAGVECAVNRAGSMITPFVGTAAVTDFDSARRSDPRLFKTVHQAWLNAGVLWPPSQFETAFLSTAHLPEDVDQAVVAFAEALRQPVLD